MAVDSPATLQTLLSAVMTVLLSLIGLGLRKFYNEWKDRGADVDMHNRILMGREDEGTQGLVDVIEQHDEKLREHEERLQAVYDQIQGLGDGEKRNTDKWRADGGPEADE